MTISCLQIGIIPSQWDWPSISILDFLHINWPLFKRLLKVGNGFLLISWDNCISRFWNRDFRCSNWIELNAIRRFRRFATSSNSACLAGISPGPQWESQGTCVWVTLRLVVRLRKVMEQEVDASTIKNRRGRQILSERPCHDEHHEECRVVSRRMSLLGP
jgi:hypothetical protein